MRFKIDIKISSLIYALLITTVAYVSSAYSYNKSEVKQYKIDQEEDRTLSAKIVCFIKSKSSSDSDFHFKYFSDSFILDLNLDSLFIIYI